MTHRFNKSQWTVALSLILSVLLLSTLIFATDNSTNPANVDVSKLQQLRVRQTEMAAKKQMESLQLQERTQLHNRMQNRHERHEMRSTNVPGMTLSVGSDQQTMVPDILRSPTTLYTGSGRLSLGHADSIYFNFASGLNGSDTLGMDVMISSNEWLNFGSEGGANPYSSPGFSNPSMLFYLSPDSSISTVGSVPAVGDSTGWTHISWDWDGGNNGAYMQTGNVWVVLTRTTNCYAVLEVTDYFLGDGYSTFSWFEFDYKYQADGSTDMGGGVTPTTPIDVLVNGADADTVEQGGEAVITIIFSEGESSAEVSMWADTDGDGALDPDVDFKVDDSNMIVDGDMDDEDGMVNGEYVITFGGPDDDEGPMRVANLNLLLQAVDAGGSDVGSLYIDPIGSAYSVSGSVSPVFANIIIGGWLSDTEDAESWMTVTDASGNYQLMLPDSGTYDIGAYDFINVTGGMFADTTYKKVLVDGNVATPYNFIFLEPTSGVEGFVFEYGTVPTRFAAVPVSGVEVWVQETDEYCNSGGSESYATTDEYGYYVVGVLEGYHRVGLDSDDLIPAYLVPNEQCLYVADSDTTEASFEVAATDAVISGTVYIGDGTGNYAPLVGVWVNGWSDLGWTETMTDEYGYYELSVSSLADQFCGYGIGVWDNDQLPPGAVSNNWPLCVPSDSSGVDIYFEVYDGGIEGFFTDAETGDTLSWNDNVWVDVWDDDYFWAGSGPNDDGYYNLPLPAGTYYVSAGGENYYWTGPDSITITNQMIWLDFDLQPVSSGVEGFLYDGGTNAPITGWAWVDVWNNDYWNSTSPDENGYYKMGLSSGSYLIQAGGDGFYTSEIDSIYVEDGQFVWRDFYLVPLALDGSVSGMVYDETTRSGVPDAEVYIWSNYYWDMTYTDETGAYNFNVPYDIYQMEVYKEDYSSDYAYGLVVNPTTPDLVQDFYIRGVSLEAVIKGQVIDRYSQTPVGYAEINAWTDYFYDYTYAGPNGYFMIDVPADSVWIDAWASGYYWSETFYVGLTPGDTIDIVIPLDMKQSGPPSLWMVRDVAPDQGGWVELGWNVGQPDDDWMLTGFSIWRMNDWGMPAFTGITVPYRGMDDYYAFAPTKNDSSMYTAQDYSYWNEFMVTAHYLTMSGDYIYLDSGWMGGYSVDNIRPAFPTNPVANFVTGNTAVEVSWDEVADEDFEYYRVYRGTVSGFVPGDPIASTLEPMFYDDAVAGASEYFYLITAVDQNGNESEYSTEALATALGVDSEGIIPNDYALSQNYPNPFNPATTVEFALPHDGMVTVKIYNLLGEEVATLVNDVRPAGYHKVTWNAGNYASGVYLLQMRSGDYSRTRKLMLMK